MKKTIIMALVCLLCTFLTGGSIVLACKCMPSKSLSDNFNFSDSTFIGKVINIEKIGRHNKITFKIKETFKGNNSTTKDIQTSTDSATCGFDFKKNGEYIVFSKKNKDGIETTGLCSGTSNLDSIKDKLSELSKIKKEYNSDEIFELVEGSTCEVATDGCNNLFMNNGKINISTMMYCPNNTPKYSCKKYTEKSQDTFNINICKTWTDGCNDFSRIENGSIISTKAYCPKEDLKPLKCLDEKTSKKEFEKKYADTCEIATDGINTFWNQNGKFNTSTLVGYPDNFTPKWKCVKEKEKFNMETCEVWTDECNTFTKMKDGGVSSTRAYCPKEDLKPLKCLDEKTSKKEFEKKYADTCEIATDGINTFWNQNGKFNTSTLVGYPDNFIPKWKCVKMKENISSNDKQDYLKKLKNNLSPSIKDKITNILKRFETKLSKLDVKAKQKVVKNVINRLENRISEITREFPTSSSIIPNKGNSRFEILSYVKLMLEKKYVSTKQ